MQKSFYTFFKSLICLFFILGLAACALNMRSPKNYQLTATNEKSYASHPISTTLLVAMPLASSGYQNNDMLYLTKDYSLSSFVLNKWDAPPSEMLQPLLTKSLQNTGYFHAVVSSPTPIRSDLRLDTSLIKLQQNFTQKPSILEMTLDAVLINSNSFQVVASRRFSVSLPTQTETPYGGVMAANEACREMMEQVSAWTVKETSLYMKKK